MARIVRAGRRTRQSKTAAWYERSKVGTLTRATDGAIAFTYDSAWLASDTAFPVASALPMSKAKWQGDPVVAAFDNLLPDAEGELRERIAARVGAQGKDVFSLLSVLGRDCVGALQFLPLDEAPAEQDMQYRIISEEELVNDLKNLAAAPLALGEDEDFRISIAGAQEKTAYLRVDGQWAKPRGITPTSHIFKTPIGILHGPDQIDLSDSVENELFCMTLAHEIGLPAAHVEKVTLPGQVVLSVERFDRVWQGDTLNRPLK
jgi:serine/threonine-protein kinase HipA